ncbi:LADA_0H11804g1_1 [Lachancea dasiensis]|uniref:LADA_0H11804g1_1 n=1 Tax=Lachancea dasiensis TaxID=1072105 RepID=A0A1G4K3K9_9SACH|nr:LADA_0H11804g1_1 [Lachancea dasiensis]
MSLSRTSSFDEQGSLGARTGKASGVGNSASNSGGGAGLGSSIPGVGNSSLRPVDIVVANFDFMPNKKSQLRLNAGDVIYVLGKHESGWWDGVIVGNRTSVRCARGWFPQNFTRSCRDRLQVAAHQAITGKTVGHRQNARSGASSRRSSLAASPAAAAVMHLMLGNNGNQSSNLSPNYNNNSSNPLLATVSDPDLLPAAKAHSSSPPPHLKEDYKFDMRTVLPSGQSMSRRASLASPAASIPMSTSGSGSMSAAGKSRSKSPCRAPAAANPPTSDGQQNNLRPSPPPQNAQIDPLQKLGSFDDRRRRSQVKSEKVTILSAEEVEMIFNNINNDCPPIWTPVATTEGKVIYYNREYDLYSSSLPFLQSPELNLKSVFPDDDWYVSLSERPLDEDRKIIDLTKKDNAAHRPPVQRLDSSSSTTNNSRSTHKPSVDEKSKSFMAAALQSQSSAGTETKSGKINNGTKDHNASESPEAPNTQEDKPKNAWWQKNANVPLLSREELFFHHRMDVRSWTELRETTLYFARKSYASFFQDNYGEFKKNFEMTSKFTIYYHNACRLLKSELVKKNLKKGVRKLLKQMLSSMSTISINGNLFFCSPQRSDLRFSPDMRHPHKSSATSSGTEVQDPLRVSITTLNPIQSNAAPKLSIGNSDFFFSDEVQHPLSGERKDASGSRFGSVMSSYTIQAHSSAIDENSNLSIQMLFQSLDNEFSNLMNAVGDLHDIMSTSCSGGGVLPQLFTRFFRDCFSGGAWTSTFQEKLVDLSPRNSIVDDGSSEPYATVNAFGSISSKAPTMEGSFMSRSSADPDLSAYQRDSFRTRPQSKSRHPLSVDTLNYMKKKLDYFTTLSFQSYETLLEQKRSKKRNLEISAACHRELTHSVAIIELLENLDLRFFLNMKNLGYKPEHDKDSEELRQHAMTSSASLLMEFFDVKQALYDVTIKKILDIQNLTLQDPYVFCSMAGDQSFRDDDSDNLEESNILKVEKLAETYYKRFLKEDVEVNALSFCDTDSEFKATQASFLGVIESAYQVVEQLMQERESILNYAARMMKNDLIAELIKGEQNKGYLDVEGKSADSEIEHIGPQDFDRSFSIDVPWYLDSEHEYSLIYDNNGNIKGGRKAALLEHLTSHQTIDASFNIAMLLSFRSIFTTSEFLHALVERYHLYPPDGLTFDEYNLWIEKKANVVKGRVVTIMKTLFSHYWTPAYYESGIDDLVSFAQLAVAQNISGAPVLLIELKNRLSLKGNLKNFVPEIIKFDESGHNYGSNALNPEVQSAGSTEVGAGYGFRMRKLKILDIDPQTFAKQLTTKDHFLYSRITPFACLDRIWGRKYCKFAGSELITKFVTSANTLTNYVAFSIVKQTNFKKRVKVIQHFVSVAESCYELNSFSSMTAIISALYSSPVYRLKKTWASVPTDCIKVLENLNTLMDPTKNFFTYRTWLKTVKDVACVPFFGVYLSDLTFIAEGNPDYLHRSTDIVNFNKRIRIVEILKQISSYQNIRYKFKLYDDVQAFIDESMKSVPTIEKQYEQSLRIEPRTDVSAGLNNSPTASKIDVSKKFDKRPRFSKSKKKSNKLSSL